MGLAGSSILYFFLLFVSAGLSFVAQDFSFDLWFLINFANFCSLRSSNAGLKRQVTELNIDNMAFALKFLNELANHMRNSMQYPIICIIVSKSPFSHILYVSFFTYQEIICNIQIIRYSIKHLFCVRTLLEIISKSFCHVGSLSFLNLPTSVI